MKSIEKLCVGPKHWERNGHWYFLSTNVSSYADIKSDWLDARNLCRKHCMDAISIETVEENDMVLDILEKRKGQKTFATQLFTKFISGFFLLFYWLISKFQNKK